MIPLHPQYITDTAGAKMVILPASEFSSIVEALEDLDDIRLYDEAKKEDDGERLRFSEYLKQRKANGA